MKRRDLFKITSAALLGYSSLGRSAASKKRVLYFTRSAGFEHSVVKRNGAALSHSEKELIEMGKRRGFEVECTKDGRVFDSDLGRFDAIAFYATGDLTQPAKDDSPPMTAAGKRKLLDAIAAGKGFVGLHSATDTFHSKGPRNENQAEVDPYIAMLGGEFVAHGQQQEAQAQETRGQELPRGPRRHCAARGRQAQPEAFDQEAEEKAEAGAGPQQQARFRGCLPQAHLLKCRPVEVQARGQRAPIGPPARGHEGQ